MFHYEVIDVFEEAPKRSSCVDMIAYKRPKVSFVFFSFSAPSKGEWCAGVSASDALNFVSKDLCWESFKVRPNRRWIQNTLFHLASQVFADEGFDLHIADCSYWADSAFKTSFESSDAGTKTEYSG